MGNNPVCFVFGLLTFLNAAATLGEVETADTTKPQIIILKLDDVVA